MATVQDKPSATPTEQGPPARLHSGDRLDQPTFHRLYEATPEGFKAELIEGTVFVAPQVSDDHSTDHADIVVVKVGNDVAAVGLGDV